MTDYDDYQISRTDFIGGENGTLWKRCLGIFKDAIVAAGKAAVKARWANTSTPSALVDCLENQGLDPAWNESESSVKARLLATWSTHEQGQTIAGISAALEAAGYADYQIIESTADPSLQWFEFDVVVSPPFPWADNSREDGAWDDPGVWDDCGNYAAVMPASDLARLRLIVSGRHKPTHARCRNIVVQHLGGGEAWDDTAPPGLWDDDPTATWSDGASFISP
jgi:hypothetical protein